MSRVKYFFTGKVEFCVHGLPLSCLNKLRQFHLSKIQILNDTVIFQAPLVHYQTIKKMVANFEYQVKENYNFFRGINFLLNHFILVVSLLVAVIAYLVVDMKIYQVRVQCDDSSLVPAVYEYLNHLGVKKYMSKKQLQNFNLAADLVGNFDNIAHAHVKISGNTLIVDLVKANYQTRKQKNNYYAQYDAVIKEVNTYSGTALVSPGDVVKKGDLLVVDAYPDSVVITGEVAFVCEDGITRLVIWII